MTSRAFDSLRGGPDSRYGISVYVGPLSGLSYNRGLASESGSGYQTQPARVRGGAAGRGAGAEGHRGQGRAPAPGATPADATPLAKVDSPPMARLRPLTNKPSDNYFAEMLVKDLGARRPAARAPRAGRRHGWRRRSRRRLGGGPAGLADGSGLSRGNRASPTRSHAAARDAQAGRVRRVLRLAARSPAATARSPRACAAAPRAAAAAARPARSPTSRRCRATARPLGRQLRLLDPHERREHLSVRARSRTGCSTRSPASG